MPVLRKMHELAITNRDQATAWLLTGAIFFAMRSCEYLTVQGDRKTKQLRLRNIRFYRHGKEILHHDPTLLNSDYISITFEDQKNGKQFDTITIQSARDLLLCPVRTWGNIIQLLFKCPGTSPDTLVNSFYSNGKLHKIIGDDMMKALRGAATSISKDTLGFEPNEIGTHSIRSRSTMGMYLAEVPVYTIMLIS